MSDDESKRDIEAEMEEADRIAREAFTRRNEEEKAATLLQYRGKRRVGPRRYRGGEPERLPEVETYAGPAGGGLIYQDVLPIPAPREPEDGAVSYDGWVGFRDTFGPNHPERADRWPDD